MSFCENCIHYEMCDWHEPMIPDNIITFFPHNEDCALFKNKADYVEVIRCKDCAKGRVKFIKNEKYIVCQLYRYDDKRQYKDEMEFCSSGARK